MTVIYKNVSHSYTIHLKSNHFNDGQYKSIWPEFRDYIATLKRTHYEREPTLFLLCQVTDYIQKRLMVVITFD